nr:MAG TPA: hypothetical protein [Caudoviricetes sp.]
MTLIWNHIEKVILMLVVLSLSVTLKYLTARL